jgi:DNA-binding MarR family transcriptional regulator
MKAGVPDIDLDRLDRITSRTVWEQLGRAANHNRPLIEVLAPRDVLVLLALADHLQSGEGRTLTTGGLARKLGCSPSAAGESVRRLARAGWILAWTERRRAYYTLNPRLWF